MVEIGIEAGQLANQRRALSCDRPCHSVPPFTFSGGAAVNGYLEKKSPGSVVLPPQSYKLEVEDRDLIMKETEVRIPVSIPPDSLGLFHLAKSTDVGSSIGANGVPCSVKEGGKVPRNTMGKLPAEDAALVDLEKGDCSVHAILDCGQAARESSEQAIPEGFLKKWSILADPLFDVNVQGAFSLAAYKTSNATSPAKDVLLHVIVFFYVLGFMSALGGRLFENPKMGAIGSAAAAVGFLLTMVLVLVM